MISMRKTTVSDWLHCVRSVLFLRYCSWDWYILPREVMWQRACRKLSILWNLAGCFYPKFPIISKKLQVPCFQSFSFLEFPETFKLFSSGIFQLVSIQLHKKTLIKICVGLLYTYVGLVLFLTGANVGFIPAGNYLGTVMASLPCPWILVPVGMVIGYFIVKAEPAVYVLMKQVEELTDGDISGKAMQISLSVGVAASVGLSMLRVLTGIPIMYFLIPGYAIALFLTLFVPKIFTAIAFDSGGVASGPMTATFLLPLAQGACTAVGGDVVKDAFGVVAMVAMTPLITLQVLGLIYKIKSNKKEEMAEQPFLQAEDVFAGYADDAIIEL